jgi:hypothetical protein
MRRFRAPQVFTLLFVAALHSLAVAQTSDRFLIIHVDAISYRTFQEALTEGYLPTFQLLFPDGITRPALSLFPGSTPVMYSRLQSGETNEAEGPIAYSGWWNRALDVEVPQISVAYELVSSPTRRARTTFVHGWVLWPFAELSVLNLPALLERYRVVEFLWFVTDTLGHLGGRAAQIDSLQRLDRALGQVLPQLDLDTLNLIVYSDHGMSFEIDEVIHVRNLISENLGDELKFAKFPNIYLNDPSKAAQFARSLGEGRLLDFVVYRVAPQRVVGYLDGSYFEMDRVGNRIAYRSEGDPFGYEALGYAGELLTADEWLRLTVDHPFPGAVPNLFQYALNPNAGDIIFGLNPPRIPYDLVQYVAHHYGVYTTDLLVPVLARGPDLEPLISAEPLWLQDLYRDIDPAWRVPRLTREEHRLSFSVNVASGDWQLAAQVSPAYRWRLLAEVESSGSVGAALSYDLLSDYLGRLWLSAGADITAAGVTPNLRIDLEIDLGRFRITPHWRLDRSGSSLGVRAEYAISLSGTRWYLTAPAAGTWGAALAW